MGAVVLLFIAGRAALQSFGTETTLSDGARAYATCKAPWHSARIAAPGKRFTLWVMTGGTGTRRDEGVAALGDRCQERARRRMGLAVVLFSSSVVFGWLARPERMRR